MVELRYLLAVVADAGSEPGRSVALALGRAGAAVLAADPDEDAAAATAREVAACRVRAWTLQADLADEADARLLAARARDLGGADLLVTCSADPATRPGADLLAARVVADAADRSRQRAGTPALVRLVPPAPGVTGAVDPAGTARAVVALLREGRASRVLDLRPPTLAP